MEIHLWIEILYDLDVIIIDSKMFRSLVLSAELDHQHVIELELRDPEIEYCFSLGEIHGLGPLPVGGDQGHRADLLARGNIELDRDPAEQARRQAKKFKSVLIYHFLFTG